MIRRLLALLLRLAPRPFRASQAEELLEVHDARWRGQRHIGERLYFGIREVAGVAFMVVRLRVEQAGVPWQRRSMEKGRFALFEAIVRETRYATRTLRRSPGFAAAAIGVLALGIGANAAIFSAANAFLFRPLPFRDADRLVMLYETNPEFGWSAANLAPANALDWREQVDAFTDVALYSEFVIRAVHVRDGEPELVNVAQVSGNFFDVLGVSALAGRAMRWEETWEGREDVVVLSHGAWATRFGSDPAVVGRRIELNGTSVEVVGVMPPGLTFPGGEIQAWTPYGWPEANREQVWFRRAHFVRGIARIAPGYSHAEADAQLQVVVRRLQEAYPETNRVMGAGLSPLRDFLVRDVRSTLLVLIGAVTLLLLLACTNVANLMLVRAGGRVREVAVRRAMGAGRGHVVRLLFAESALLAMAGGVVGLAIGWLGVRALQQLNPVGIAGATTLALDHRVVLFTVAISGAAAILFGAVPALRSAGGRAQEALKEGGRGTAGGRRSKRIAGSLVAAELAFASALVVGAGLMVRTVTTLRRVDPGFRTDGVLAVQFTVPSARYENRDAVLSFYDRLSEALESRPGIHRVGLIGQLPLNGTSWSSQFQAEGWPPDRVGFEILHRRADRGYFEALGIPLVRGRLFEPGDRPDGPLVVVINERFAEEHFPGEDPIGQRIAYDRAAGPESTWYEIVGIVGNQQQTTPREPARAEVFEHSGQDWGRSNWLVVRGSADVAAMLPVVRSTLREIDPLIPMAAAQSLRSVWTASMARERYVLVLLTVFGIVALLLATVGVYGVTAEALRKRTAEIGVRMALGAAARDVVALMLRHTIGVVAIGLGVGLVATLLLARTLRSLLFGVQPSDPWTLIIVALFLGGTALFASWLPARRATRVDPVTSLRTE